MDQNFVAMLLMAIDDRVEQIDEAIVTGRCEDHAKYQCMVARRDENLRFRETVKEAVEKWNKQWDR